MSKELTEKWKKGELEALDELINQISAVDNSRSLSDEYLKEKGLMTREECGPAAEYPYGIVVVVSDYVLPYLKELQALKEENAKLKRLLKTCKSKVLYVKTVRSDARKMICDDIVSDIEEVVK